MILLTGCSTLELPKYPVGSAVSYPDSVTKDGLIVAAKPILDKNDSQKYFGADLIASNILAILVVAENHNLSSSFIIDNRNISLLHYEKKEDSLHIAESDNSSGVAMSAVGGLLLSPLLIVGGVLQGAKTYSDAGMVRYNFESQALKSHTLSPGDSTSGFVYFQVPKGGLQKKLSIHIESENLQNREIEKFNLVIPGQMQ
jgi:hypothetical protein